MVDHIIPIIVDHSTDKHVVTRNYVCSSDIRIHPLFGFMLIALATMLINEITIAARLVSPFLKRESFRSPVVG